MLKISVRHPQIVYAELGMKVRKRYNETMFKSPLAWLIAFSVFLVGCASTSSSTAINADGTWTRTLKLTVRDMPSFGDNGKQEKKPEVFGVPAGADWTKSEEKKPDGTVTTYKKSFKVGDDLATDIIIKGKDGTKYKNFVTVRKLEGNRLEYYEKIVLVGSKTSMNLSGASEYMSTLKDALPPGKATDEDLKIVGQKTEVAMIRMMLGPDDHLFGLMLTNLDGATRRIRNKVGSVLNRVLTDQFGTRLTDQERSAAIKKIIAKFDNENPLDPAKSASSADPTDTNSSFLGMSAAVKLPGKIVSTNGEIDEYTGEVYWDFMSDSAGPDVLELRAICQL